MMLLCCFVGWLHQDGFGFFKQCIKVRELQPLLEAQLLVSRTTQPKVWDERSDKEVRVRSANSIWWHCCPLSPLEISNFSLAMFLLYSFFPRPESFRFSSKFKSSPRLCNHVAIIDRALSLSLLWGPLWAPGLEAKKGPEEWEKSSWKKWLAPRNHYTGPQYKWGLESCAGQSASTWMLEKGWSLECLFRHAWWWWTTWGSPMKTTLPSMISPVPSSSFVRRLWGITVVSTSTHGLVKE